MKELEKFNLEKWMFESGGHWPPDLFDEVEVERYPYFLSECGNEE